LFDFTVDQLITCFEILELLCFVTISAEVDERSMIAISAIAIVVAAVDLILLTQLLNY